MMSKVIYTRNKYSEALHFPGHLEVRVLIGRKRFRLQQSVAIVWTLINGYRTAEDIHFCVQHLIGLETVKLALEELLKIKLIHKDVNEKQK